MLVLRIDRLTILRVFFNQKKRLLDPSFSDIAAAAAARVHDNDCSSLDAHGWWNRTPRVFYAAKIRFVVARNGGGGVESPRSALLWLITRQRTAVGLRQTQGVTR